MEDFTKLYTRLKSGLCFPVEELKDTFEVWVWNELEPFDFIIRFSQEQLELFSQRTLKSKNWQPSEVGLIRVNEDIDPAENEPSFLLDVNIDGKFFGLCIKQSELEILKVNLVERSFLMEATNFANNISNE
jgi:hypothetical protein